MTEEGESLAEEQSEACPDIQDGEGHGSDQSRSEKPEDLMKFLAMMLLSWQSAFKISDNAITSLLLCIKQFVWILGNVLCVNSLTAFSSNIPAIYRFCTVAIIDRHIPLAATFTVHC